MKPDISEFSYGFAITSEIMQRYPTIRYAGAPTFPSLYEEGRSGGGYDVEIPGAALFLQFKLSEVLTRANAKEADLLGLPYFRMRLRPAKHSKQHELLLALENENAGLVFYVAPEFHTPGELNSAYLGQTVLEESAFFSPTDIGEFQDEGSHYVVFREGSDESFACSEPTKVRRTLPRKFLELLAARAPRKKAERGGPSPQDFYRDLTHQMLEIYGKQGGKLPEADISSLLDRARSRSSGAMAQFISQSLFDCELLVSNLQ